MSKTPVDFVVAIFPTQNGADAALKQAQEDNLAGIQETAVLHKDEEHKVHIHEPEDMGGGKGAAIGAIVGGLIGLVTGPGAVIVGAAGAAIGGLTAKLHDTGFDNKDLAALAESLRPGKSAILATVEEQAVDQVAEAWSAAGGEERPAEHQSDIPDRRRLFVVTSHGARKIPLSAYQRNPQPPMSKDDTPYWQIGLLQQTSRAI